MRQEDYLLREIEKIGTVIAAIRNKIFGDKDSLAISVENVRQEIDGMLLSAIHFDLQHFLEMDDIEATRYLSSFEAFTVELIEIFADTLEKLSLSEHGDMSGAYLHKALFLLNYCNQKDKRYSEERESLIQKIQSQLR